MNLEHFIVSNIYRWPTLYRADTYEISRILFLGHVFTAYGTGLEWHPDGFLADHTWLKNGKEHYYTKIRIKKLPKDYFSMRLWCLDVSKDNVARVKKALKGHFYYINPPNRCEGKENVEFVFEGDEAFATEITAKYKELDEFEKKLLSLGRPPFLNEAISYYHANNTFKNSRVPIRDSAYVPTSMCEYSPIVEMINKKTNSPHLSKNFVIAKVLPDWIKGAVDIAKYAVDVYEDPKKCINCYYHPINCLYQFEESYKKDPKCLENAKKSYGLADNASVEDWANACWEREKKVQLGYFYKFLEMYDK